jgi:hypothetical protein
MVPLSEQNNEETSLLVLSPWMGQIKVVISIRWNQTKNYLIMGFYPLVDCRVSKEIQYTMMHINCHQR